MPDLDPAPVNGSAPSLVDEFGKPLRVTNDPAWQPPRDPLKTEDVKARAEIIHREIPLSVVVTGWDVPSARAAKRDLVIGLFQQPAQMVDAIILSDSRVQAGLASRLSILGRPVDFKIPRKYRDSALARECLDAFTDAWPEMATEAAMSELQRWAVMMGFGVAQNLWDFSGEYAIPHPMPWHPKYVYFHWLYRCYVAITMDGQEPITPGDASWILHAPHGDYRGWMRGAVGAITPWWLGRAYALRDWMRYSERHGLPMLKAKTPAVGDPYQQAIFRVQLANLGSGAVFHLPQNPPPALSYDLELLEAKDTAHEGFRMLIEQCNQEITLALLAQTLTTSMPAEGGSSYAAARVHAGVLQGLMEADARALTHTVYRQLARPFAAINFGNPDLAPMVTWDVTPYEDAETRARTFMAAANALNLMKGAGYKPHDIKQLIKFFQLDIGSMEELEKGAEIFAYDLQMGVASINEARERKGLPPRDGGDKTYPEIQRDLGEDAEAPSGAVDKAQARIAALMARIDPRIGERAERHVASFIGGEDEGLREAMAEIEATSATRRRYVPA